MAYFLCELHEVRGTLEHTPQSQTCAARGGSLLSPGGVICVVPEDVCTSWIESDAYIVPPPPLPATGDAAELYAFGFGAVLAPVLLLWIGAVIVRGIRLVSQRGEPK